MLIRQDDVSTSSCLSSCLGEVHSGVGKGATNRPHICALGVVCGASWRSGVRSPGPPVCPLHVLRKEKGSGHARPCSVYLHDKEPNIQVVCKGVLASVFSKIALSGDGRYPTHVHRFSKEEHPTNGLAICLGEMNAG